MKVALLGYGKMGHTIEEVLLEQNKNHGTHHEVVLKIDEYNREGLSKENLKKADVAIDFSVPAAAFENIKSALEAGIPVVSGTTGWLEKLEEAKQLSGRYNTAFLYASNFSIGVNIFFDLNKKLAELMKNQHQYHVQVEETHHTQKLDSPSGTAITLAEEIIKSVKAKTKWVNNPSDKPDELVILSHREPGVPGTHVVEYESEVDTIEIIHTAHSRRGFAEGAAAAAEWIIGKQGVFTMKDVLGL